MKKAGSISSFRFRRMLRKLHKDIQEAEIEDTPTMKVLKERFPEELEEMKKYCKKHWNIEVGQ